MAKLRPRGTATSSIYEGEPYGPSRFYNQGIPFGPTIGDLIAKLQLAPMSSEEVEEIRFKLQLIVGSWEQVTSGLESRGVADTLTATAQCLEDVKAVLQAGEQGLQKEKDIEVVLRSKEVLSLNPEINKMGKAEEYLLSFCQMAETISHTCRVAACELGSIKGKSGRMRYQWYDKFTKLLCEIAHKNGIKTTVENDRKTHQPKGRFIEVAEAFEPLFPPRMRSPSRVALAKRLSTSLRPSHDTS